MRKTIIILFTVLFFMPVVAKDNQNVFINRQVLLRAYGYSTGGNESKNLIIKQLQDVIVKDVGKFEKSSEIDTPDEFIVAAFYSKLDGKTKQKREVILRELSTGKMGGLRLGALWLRRRIEDGKMHEAPLNYIQKQSKITREDILDYYRQAMSAEVDRVVAEVMKGVPKKYYDYFRNGDPDDPNDNSTKIKVNAIDLIKEYFYYPSKENYENLLHAVRYFGLKSATSSDAAFQRFKAFVSIIEKLSPGLKNQLVKDIAKNNT